MKATIALVIKAITLCTILLLCFNTYNSMIFNGYALSNMHIAFTLCFAIITSYKYYVLKSCIESKSKNKFLKTAIFLIFFFIIINAIYIIVPKKVEVNNWMENIKRGQETKLKDFAFLPYYFNSLNILKMTTIETIFSLILIYLAYIREKKKTGYITYVLDRILKISYRYNLSITFLIYILTVPNKFLTVKTVKYTGIGILFLVVLFEIVKNYLVIRSCKNKNKEKYGKENLIIIVTSTNFTFSFSEHIINPLYKFFRYDNKNLVKSLLVSGKMYTFVLYDAIRYEMIKKEQYKNISYLIIINEDILLGDILYPRNKAKIFKEKIEEITTKNSKFMFYITKSILHKSQIVSEIKSKYSFRVKNKIDVKDTLEMTMIKPEADILKEKIKKLLEYIENKELNNYIKKKKSDNKIAEEKNIYLKYGMNLILLSFNYIEYFYTMLKMSEYVIHYMGLKSLIEEKIITNREVDNIKQATWRNFVKFQKEYSSENKEKIEGIVSQKDIINSIIEMRKVINKTEIGKSNDKELLKDTYTFKDICQTVADIRNKILVHGVILPLIAEKHINDLFNILFILVKEFEELNITIEDDEKIKNIFKKDLLAVYRYSERLFLYSNPVIEDKEIKYNECMNYETGKKKIIDAEATINLAEIVTMEKIDKQLEKWVKIYDETKNNKS